MTICIYIQIFFCSLFFSILELTAHYVVNYWIDWWIEIRKKVRNKCTNFNNLICSFSFEKIQFVRDTIFSKSFVCGRCWIIERLFTVFWIDDEVSLIRAKKKNYSVRDVLLFDSILLSVWLKTKFSPEQVENMNWNITNRKNNYNADKHFGSFLPVFLGNSYCWFSHICRWWIIDESNREISLFSLNWKRIRITDWFVLLSMTIKVNRTCEGWLTRMNDSFAIRENVFCWHWTPKSSNDCRIGKNHKAERNNK